MFSALLAPSNSVEIKKGEKQEKKKKHLHVRMQAMFVCQLLPAFFSSTKPTVSSRFGLTEAGGKGQGMTVKLSLRRLTQSRSEVLPTPTPHHNMHTLALHYTSFHQNF